MKYVDHTKKSDSQKIKDLIELNDELENYFNNTIIPQLFVDANLILRKFTPPAMKHFNFTPDHIGKPIKELIDNIRFSTILVDIKDIIESGKILEKEIQTENGRWFQMNIIPYLIKKENRVNGVIITFVDITDRIETLKELEKLNAVQETFIHALSHDLKGPLGNIEGLINLLNKKTDELMSRYGLDNEEQRNVSAMLVQSVKSLRNIINDLSEVTKIENNYKEGVESVNLEEIVNEVNLILHENIIKSKAEILIDIRETEINYSRKNLRSIIYNLVSNAIKYKRPDSSPKINISIEKEIEYVKLRISDNGKGITKENLKIIFKPFTRFEKNIEGTGIGLYLIKKIIENDGGKIILNSKIGEGTEAVVLLKPMVNL